jgi:hypothetical protein
MMCNRIILLLAVSLVLSACEQETKKVVPVVAGSKVPKVMDPFKFHKLVEVSPGNDFDVLSWGRGANEKSAYLILHSDSADQKYTTTTGDLDGTIVDAYNTDMDVDGNPEILIQSRGKDSTNYLTMIAFEFTGSKANKLELPRLTSSQRKGYRGGDEFYITDGKLMRKFAIYQGSGKEAKPTGAQRVFEYGLHNNSFTVKQISKDSASVKSDKPVPANEPVKQEKKAATHVKTESHHSTKKADKHKTRKHHQTEHQSSKKKKHRRHHSSD